MTQNDQRQRRTPLATGIGLALCLAFAATGTGTAQETQQGQAAPDPDQPNAMERLGSAAGRVVERPLKDFNIIKPKPQPALEAVMDDPYSLRRLKTCGQYRAEIARLTAALGPDVDSPQTLDPSHTDTRAEFALGAGEAVASSFIPGGGLIRKISGAEKRQKYAAAAVYAGSIRRAYLKGLMRGKNCRA